MKLEVELGGFNHELEFEEDSGRFRLDIAGQSFSGELSRPEPGTYTFYIGDRVADARVSKLTGTDEFRVSIGGVSREVRVVDRKHRSAGHDAGVEGKQTLVAPMPGKIVELLAGPGDAVSRGQGVIVVEAMKMQNEVKSPKDGVIAEVRVAAGDTVTAGQVLVVIE